MLSHTHTPTCFVRRRVSAKRMVICPLLQVDSTENLKSNPILETTQRLEIKKSHLLSWCSMLACIRHCRWDASHFFHILSFWSSITLGFETYNVTTSTRIGERQHWVVRSRSPSCCVDMRYTAECSPWESVHISFGSQIRHTGPINSLPDPRFESERRWSDSISIKIVGLSGDLHFPLSDPLFTRQQSCKMRIWKRKYGSEN